jgi:hypothetical protein
MTNKKPGKKIPGGTGKCICPRGICTEYIPAGNIGEDGERAPIKAVNASK